MKRIVAAAIACMAVTGCGSTRLPVGRAPHTTREPERVGDAQVLVVTRPLGEFTAVGLWIDAGTLDGPNATTALVAAEIAAETASARGSRRVESVVLPDGTSLRMICARSELAACVQDLAAGLALRDVEPEAFERALARVGERRDRGLGDARRSAETLAASATLGLPLAPLGDPADVVRADDVRTWIAAHFGASRALLVVVGEVTAETVTPHLDALASVHATRSREARREVDEARVVTEESSGTTMWSMAVRLPDRDAALGTAHAWSRRGALVGGVTTAAFPTRAGWVALMSFEAGALDPHTAAEWLRVPRAPQQAVVADDAWSIVDREGALWIASPGEGHAWRAGAGAVGAIPEGLASELDRRLREAPVVELVVREVDDVDDVAAAWALSGPSAEGAASHGATAIAARILARRCADGAAVAVEPDAVVVTLRGEAAHVRSEAAFWRDCVRAAPPTDMDIEDARTAEIAALGADDIRRALVAERVAPTAPGAIAPHSSVVGLAGVANEDVRAIWAAWRERSRLLLAGSRSQLGALAAARESPAPPRSVIATVTPEAPSPVRRRLAGATAAELLVSVALPGCASAGAARAVLATWARAARETGAQITWAGSGVGSGLAWLALSARGEADALQQVATLRIDATARARAAAEGRRDEASARALARADLRRLARDEVLGERGDAVLDPGTCAAAPVVHLTWLDPDPAAARGDRAAPR